ncbi:MULTISPECIES: AtpZ/AtpI family protein [Rhodopseudomonas]|uniref:ATP synthase F0 subunit A n=1 Tax=Rhodopseudomonas palustris TaxID=1076 RepID=A0A0D7EGH2_RHOPL|nr:MULTISPECIES: AtpZ/AtpI family protein [Rhodopseudomonas]KIZ39833.1 ATP synthase F0 subunit A' [Rhodopseudomonas palustris]MDF3814395.1 AtpZ/AtpI family protein [Rhodopseudomonas sp. BAL398]WOK20815.1 AtpZ/AtpI family protein [Rhodopseudomonas sp. BAL398]
MAEDAHAGGDHQDDNRGAMLDEAALSARLGSLERRLSQSRESRKGQTDQSGTGSENAKSRASAMARGVQLSSELVAGVVVGALIGWGIDHLLSTSPWGLIVFFLLGFIAGLINLIRSAGVAPERTKH